MIVRPLSTVDNTRDYARVSHNRQWSNYNVFFVCRVTIASKSFLDFSVAYILLAAVHAERVGKLSIMRYYKGSVGMDCSHNNRLNFYD